MRSNPPAVAAFPVLLLPVLLALAGCTANDTAAPSEPFDSPSASPSGLASSAPTPTLSPSLPAAGATLPSDAAALEEWAAAALPEDGLGGSTAVARGTGEVGPTGASVGLAPVGGSWDLVVACESTTGAPLTVQVGVTGTAVDVACGAPGQTGAAPTTIRWDATTSATLRVDASTPAVFVYEVHPRAGV